MKKVAFFTMDVEALSETSCIQENIGYNHKAYDVRKGVTDYFNLLQKYDIQATFFATAKSISCWQGELSNIIKHGNEIAIHSLIHESVVEYSYEAFSESIRRMKEQIKDHFQITPIGYRAPCFGIGNHTINWLESCGIKYDSSALNYKKALRSNYLNLDNFRKINDVVYEKNGFFEFKPSVVNTFFGEIPVCGGAYMRMMPWGVAKYVFTRYIHQSDAFLFYVHPFELVKGDFALPKKMPLKDKIYLQRGRKKYIQKIEYIIKILKQENYEFYTLGKYIQMIGG